MTGKRGMTNILFLVAILFISFPSLYAFTWSRSDSTSVDLSQSTRTIKIIINGSYETEMKILVPNGVLEIYSILGKRVIAIQLTDNENIYSVALNKGMYVIRIGKNTQKIVIKG